MTRKTLSDVILDSSYADTLQVDFRLGIVGHLVVHSAVATASLPVLAKLYARVAALQHQLVEAPRSVLSTDRGDRTPGTTERVLEVGVERRPGHLSALPIHRYDMTLAWVRVFAIPVFSGHYSQSELRGCRQGEHHHVAHTYLCTESPQIASTDTDGPVPSVWPIRTNQLCYVFTAPDARQIGQLSPANTD